MLTEVMEYYGLERSPVDVEFFETDHHAQISRDLRTAIMSGRLIALTAVIGSGKTVLSRQLRTELEREGRVSSFTCWKAAASQLTKGSGTARTSLFA